MAPEINYLAVLVAVIANIILGWLWYGPFFGRTWAGIIGMDVNQKPARSEMTKSMVFMIISSFLMAWVLDHALIFGNKYLGTSGVGAGLMGAFFNWLGFIVPVTLGPVLWEKKPWKLWFINAGYYLVALCIMGIILSLWM